MTASGRCVFSSVLSALPGSSTPRLYLNLGIGSEDTLK